MTPLELAEAAGKLPAKIAARISAGISAYGRPAAVVLVLVAFPEAAAWYNAQRLRSFDERRSVAATVLRMTPGANSDLATIAYDAKGSRCVVDIGVWNDDFRLKAGTTLRAMPGETEPCDHPLLREAFAPPG